MASSKEVWIFGAAEDTERMSIVIPRLERKRQSNDAVDVIVGVI